MLLLGWGWFKCLISFVDTFVVVVVTPQFTLAYFDSSLTVKSFHANDMLAVSVRSLIHLRCMKWFRIGLVKSAFHCSCKTATVSMCAFPGPPCPLLPLPGNSRYKLTSLDVPDMVSYPLPQSSSSYSGHAPSSVAMVSGLHPSKMNCTRIFNLFCLYGNIEKVSVCLCILHVSLACFCRNTATAVNFINN